MTNLGDFQRLTDVSRDFSEEPDFNLRDVKSVSYVSRRRLDDADFDVEEVDSDGLPLVYNEERISQFWRQRPGELAARWTRFGGIAAPWLIKLANAAIRGNLEAQQGQLAREAVDNLQRLGPTFVKLGQILSIRPDVLPPAVMKELARLQDNLATFPSSEARQVIEQELGRPVDEVFAEFSAEPVAAASLAQVFRARLRATGELVAVKVQRPGALSTISKDLYVMRRGIGVYERLVKRFTAQTTDYQQLLSTFAEGLYTEMDFRNEALNGIRMQQLLDESEFASADIVIPRPFMEYSTRRVLTMEWVTGVKLTTLQPEEIRVLVKAGQESFLTQLLDIGFFHGDPHPGNLLKVTEGPNAGKLALLDFGLVAEVPPADREAMISATIHLANRDWDGLIDDFVALGFLPFGCDRGLIIPVMEKVLSPYLRGGGAKAFNFTALSQDLLSATLNIPFSVPPYMSLLARSVASLEGIALVGDPGYQMVAQAYPYVVRKVMRNSNNGATRLLRDIVYDPYGNIKPTRLSALLNAALGYVAEEVDGFVDLDAVPDDGASVQDIIAFLLSPEARDLRPMLVREVVNGLDLFARARTRRAYASLPTLAPRLPFVGSLPTPPLPPMFVPGRGLMKVEDVVQLLAPALSQQEEIYLQSLTEVVESLLGLDKAALSEPSLASMFAVLLNPSAQVQELQQALRTLSGSRASAQVLEDITEQVVPEVVYASS
ncbi:hypothetical protein WJX72_000728 [[Myrmecia] bisecta]|uniref:Protein kinase domain-containing protein n=1 Tax=[Myrmecia] bisecta TaxID=41462 RepID=A0AAW1R4A8_9CHLO